MSNEQGGIVDDLLIYRIDEKNYMLVVNASNMEKDWNWIAGHNSFGVEMQDISDQTTLLAVQGPKAAEALQRLTDVDWHRWNITPLKKEHLPGLITYLYLQPVIPVQAVLNCM